MLEILEIPGIFPDPETAKKAILAWKPYETKILEERANAVLLAMAVYPDQAIFSKRPVRKVEERESNNLKPRSGILTVVRVLDLLFIGTGYIAGVLYGVLAFFVTYDVLARKWGSYLGLPTTRVTDEISGYMLALAATWAFAYALRTDAHVPVDVMFPYMGRRLKAAMDFIALILMALFATIITRKIWALVLDSIPYS